MQQKIVPPSSAGHVTEFPQIWSFFAALRQLAIRDSCLRLAVLCALLEASRSPKQRPGAPISWIAGRIGETRQCVRYHLHMLRADGAAVISGKLGKTELYALTDSAREQTERCLRSLIAEG